MTGTPIDYHSVAASPRAPVSNVQTNKLLTPLITTPLDSGTTQVEDHKCGGLGPSIDSSGCSDGPFVRIIKILMPWTRHELSGLCFPGWVAM